MRARSFTQKHEKNVHITHAGRNEAHSSRLTGQVKSFGEEFKGLFLLVNRLSKSLVLLLYQLISLVHLNHFIDLLGCFRRVSVMGWVLASAQVSVGRLRARRAGRGLGLRGLRLGG